MSRNNYESFHLAKVNLTKYLFFTGKGGVGKTSTACAVAINLADNYARANTYSKALNLKHLNVLIEDIYTAGKRVIFTMGKGGVGKTTIAVALARKGVKVHLTSTDPADHLKYVV